MKSVSDLTLQRLSPFALSTLHTVLSAVWFTA